MANIDFPSTPTDGQTATLNGILYTYNSAKTQWKVTAAQALTIGDTAPSNTTAVPLWWDSSTGRLFIYYNDGTSSQWVDTQPGFPGTTGPTGPTGPTGATGATGATPTIALTGVITSSGNATSIASQTGTGTKFVVDTSPTITTPIIVQSINAQTTAAYVTVASDAGAIVTVSNASANTFKLPTNASVAYAIGSTITLIQIGAGATTISAVTPATTIILSTGATPASPVLAQYKSATCIKTGTDAWYIVGALA